MPNYVKNVVKFKKVNEEIVENLVAKLSNFDLDTEVDFGKIIPEPKTKADCPKEYLLRRGEGIEAIDGKEWFNWYKWHIDKWGTKWNACCSYVKKGKSWVTFVFETAWSCPFPILKELAKLGYNMEVKYADEDIGCNCGKLYYNKEKKRLCKEPIEDENKVGFAQNLWRNY